jgi:predicted nucleic acid-binding protein
MEKYSDLPMDFADACLVYLAEKLRLHTIVTIDRDFNIYRIKGKINFNTINL